MRHLLSALVLFAALPALTVAEAQVPTLPPIGLPLPQISQPLPLIGLEASDIIGPAPPVDRGGRGRPHDRPHPHWRPAFVYFVSPYEWDATRGVAVPGIVVSSAPTAAAHATTGRLRLDLSPTDGTQVFVDGEYVGTPSDFHNELELQAGTRRLEIRAPGHEANTVDVRVMAGETITYRVALKPVAAAAPAAVEPAGNRTFYLIPGCYMGNVPPRDVKLPPGCDVSRVIVHTPQ